MELILFLVNRSGLFLLKVGRHLAPSLERGRDCFFFLYTCRQEMRAGPKSWSSFIALTGARAELNPTFAH